MLLAQSLSITADLPSWSIAWVNNRYFRKELRNPMQWIVRFNIKRTWARSLIHADVDYRSVPTSRLLRCYNQIFYTSWQSISCECSEPKWNCQCHVSHGACERRRYTSNFKACKSLSSEQVPGEVEEIASTRNRSWPPFKPRPYLISSSVARQVWNKK